VTQFPSPYSAEGSDENQWRRPSGEAGQKPPLETPLEAPSYAGPPRPAAPAPGWRPPTMISVPAPRNLPAQDQESIERVERRALTTTYGVGMIAGAIGLLLLIVLCGRLVF
jgi:hypothetical protein